MSNSFQAIQTFFCKFEEERCGWHKGIVGGYGKQGNWRQEKKYCWCWIRLVLHQAGSQQSAGMEICAANQFFWWPVSHCWQKRLLLCPLDTTFLSWDRCLVRVIPMFPVLLIPSSTHTPSSHSSLALLNKSCLCIVNVEECFTIQLNHCLKHLNSYQIHNKKYEVPACPSTVTEYGFQLYFHV